VGGLRIWPNLNRNLIVARALLDADCWGFERNDETPLERPATPDPILIRQLFLALAGGTDSLTYYLDEVESLFPELAAIEPDAADAMLDLHSYSIFENANSITTVNEGN
jgi:hypothetical protein